MNEGKGRSGEGSPAPNTDPSAAADRPRPAASAEASQSEGNPGDPRQPCCRGNCSGGVDRRAFLKTAGAGAVSLSLLGPSRATSAPAADAPPAVAPHLVPAEKNLAPAWVRSLFAKGTAEVFRGKALDTIGMPIGGIAAGQLYLLGDGTLGCWQIFNKHHFSGYGADCYTYRTPDSPVEQGFAVVVETGGRTLARRLNRKDIANVEFIGEYPIGRVRYADATLPVRVEMEAFSPFIPLNASDSTLPATLFHLTIENVSAQRIETRVLAWLENAVCFHTAGEISGLRRSRIAADTQRTLILHTAQTDPKAQEKPLRPTVVLADFEGDDYGDWKATGQALGDKPAGGTLPEQQEVSGFQGKGLVNTFLGGDGPQGTLTSPPFTISRRYINFLVGGGSHADQTCMNLQVGGKTVRTAVGKNEERLTWRSWSVEAFEGQEARIEIVDRHSGGWGHINVDQIELADERRGDAVGPLETLEDYGSMVLAFGGKAEAPASARRFVSTLGDFGVQLNVEQDVAYPISQRQATALVTTPVTLAPGAKETLTFVLAWHFPNHQNGHAYATRFGDASDVARYVLDQHARLAGDTRAWHDTYYDSTLPHWLLDRLHWTVANLATGTCQLWKDGRFWAWEGVGCCHGTCTHVWNYAHALARLFPELERTIREMQDLGVALHPDGVIGFRGERNGQYAADGQAGTILKCYREHQMSADNEFLRRNWPNIKKALSYSITQDANDDGLIENSQHNTYDINFVGANTFVGSLYLAALRAGEEMARDVGDLEFAARLHAIFDSGRRLSVERLWNGEYFIQTVDLAKHPKDQYGEGCLSDQLFGQGWAHQLGLGYIYPESQVKQALQSVWKYNWAPDVGPYNAVHKPERWFVRPGEPGLFTCTWPRSTFLAEGVRYRSEVWTGIEYQVAGHMVWEEMLDEALVMIRAIHDRYDGAKHNPYNEVECGDHYARAMASWGVFLALGGYEYHGPRGHLGFSPRITPEDFRCAFTAAEGWGTFAQQRNGRLQNERITVRRGKLRLETLAFSVPGEMRSPNVAVTIAGKPVEVTHNLEEGRLRIAFRQPLIINEGASLEVRIG